MNRFVGFILVTFITGCSVVSEQEVLIVESSNWQTTELFSKKSYLFECPNIRLLFDDIVLSNQITAYRPLLPIIPSDKKMDNSDQALKLTLTVIGKVKPVSVTESDFNLIVKAANDELLTDFEQHFNVISDQPFEDGKWIQYQLVYQYAKNLQTLISCR